MTRSISGLCVALLVLATTAVADDNPNQDRLITLQAQEAVIAGDSLTLTDVGEQMLWFSERPLRKAGHVPSAQLVEIWAKGSDSFAGDPPNAVLAGQNDGADQALVLEIDAPDWNDGTLTFTVRGVGAALPDNLTLEDVNLFIDGICLACV